MNNNIKLEDIKSEPLTTDQKEFLVSGLFSMMSNEDNYFVSKEKYDELENRINKAIKYIEHHKFNKFGDIDCGEAEEIINILVGSDKE